MNHHLLKVVYLLILLIFTSCNSNLELIEANQINSQKKQFAEQMANTILQRCTDYDYSALSEKEVTPEMIKGFNAQVFQETCDLLRGKYGRFRGLEFVEAYKPKDSNQYTIYRFKGNFKEAIQFPEIRITIDQSGKLAGFFTTKWRDEI